MHNPRRSQLVPWATLLAGVALGAYGLLWSGPGAAAADSTITFTEHDRPVPPAMENSRINKRFALLSVLLIGLTDLGRQWVSLI